MKHTNKFVTLILLITITLFVGCQAPKEEKAPTKNEDGTELPVTKLPNMKSGAEFYFSPDSKSMIGNAKYEGDESHKIYTINIDGADKKKITEIIELSSEYMSAPGIFAWE